MVVKGLDKLMKDVNKALNKVSYIAATEYAQLIKNNLIDSMDSGLLYSSFLVSSGKSRSKVYSLSKYAAIQNYGGRIKVTESMANKMWYLFKTTGNSKYKAIALKKGDYITIPAKNYLKVSKGLWFKKVDVELNKITIKI